MNYIPSKLHLLPLVALLASPLILAVEEETESPEPVCLDSSRVRNFDPLSDEHLFVEERTNEFYLITLDHSCFGLRNARVIAFKDNTRRICSDDNFVDIVVRDMGRATSCGIDNIEAVENKEVAEAMVAELEQAEDEANAAEKAAKEAEKASD